MSELSQRLLAWHADHGRHDLPWQHPRTAYRVWLSEIMLQQTRVATVVDYFQRFVAELPNLPSLAAAHEDMVMALWSGLGYYRRARNLHAAARICQRQHGGVLPNDYAALLALPGIGRSTAGAILALAHGQRHAILDGNAKRVLARHFAIHGWPGKAGVERQLWALAEANTPAAGVTDYTQAIMDLGATICTRAKPRCEVCPLMATCRARREGLTDQLPTKRARKPLPQRDTCMLVLRDEQGRVLLRRRDAEGVWPNLWSLPEAEQRDHADDMAARWVRTPAAARALEPIQHQFTHFRLRVQPLLWRGVEPRPGVADAPAWGWFAADDYAKLGLPAPVRRLLDTIEQAGTT